MYWPPKYYRGLSKTKKAQRRRDFAKTRKLSWRDPKAYRPFRTDAGVKTRSSSYTEAWVSRFPEAKSLKQKAAATGVPLRFILASYNRGLAAWRTGHRPGATQQQWGYARVHSFLTCGKTYKTTDSDLAKKAKKTASARKWWAARC
jgi:hypothetical protein